MHHVQDQVCIYYLNRGYFTTYKYICVCVYIHLWNCNTGSEIYERLPDSGPQADDLDERVGSDEFIGGRLAGGEVQNQEGADHQMSKFPYLKNLHPG